jgi:dihydroorotase
VDPASGRQWDADVHVCRGEIAGSDAALPADAQDLDARGHVLVPGLWDLHVHLRESGTGVASGSLPETLRSGSAAAARGGFTTLVTMPNTQPPTDSPQELSALREKAAACGAVRILPSACLTRGRLGRSAAPLAELAGSGAAAFTDDGNTVADDRVMEAAMAAAAALGLPVLDHAADPVRSGAGVMHAGAAAARLGLPGVPSAAESDVVERDIRLSRQTGCRLHVQHVSARESVALIRQARLAGLPVTAELTPHHLALCDADIPGDDANYKMNPPLGGAADREALIEAAVEGTIAAFATDHAPHPAAEKARGFLRAPSGVVGLETAIGVTYTALVAGGRMSFLEWLRRWTTGPASILGRDGPRIAPGQPADLVLLDVRTEWTVDPALFLSRSRNTPFAGRRLRGKALWTLCGGRLTWKE